MVRLAFVWNAAKTSHITGSATQIPCAVSFVVRLALYARPSMVVWPITVGTEAASLCRVSPTRSASFRSALRRLPHSLLQRRIVQINAATSVKPSTPSSLQLLAKLSVILVTPT